jgi:hypothetical protein
MDADRTQSVIKWTTISVVLIGLLVAFVVPGVYQIVDGQGFSWRRTHLRGNAARLDGVARVLLWMMMPAFCWYLHAKGSQKILAAVCAGVFGTAAVAALFASHHT